MFTLPEWQARAAALRLRTQIWIDGKAQPAASGARFETVNPGTGQILADIAKGGAEDIDRAVKSARRADKRHIGQFRQSYRPGSVGHWLPNG